MRLLSKRSYSNFLDAGVIYLSLNSPWIPIDPLDQEKTTFTCPYGTFSYRRMPFGLCNAPSTFQRTPILVLKLGKCHFMVKEGIVLGHKISKSGIEVDKSKVDVIAKLPHPTTVKEAFDILKALPVDHPGDTKVPIYTAKKVLRFRFYWTTIYKDGMTLSPDVTFVNVRAKFRQRDEMTQYSIPVCKILTCGLKGVDFMGPFPKRIFKKEAKKRPNQARDGKDKSEAKSVKLLVLCYTEQHQRQQQQVTLVPPNLVEPPKDTMADDRTMAELLSTHRGK
ncbi:hypothetical protein Tco_0209683 [Tanacetum coccineum]